jgi:adenylate kinase family enzyme
MPELRILIIGTAGAGKTTLAKALSARLGVPHLELDTVNWQAGWVSLQQTDVEEFKRRVAEAAVAPEWIIDGNYGPVKDIVWNRATDIVWLDYERGLIMRRVIGRTLKRMVSRRPLWNGNREDWRGVLDADHPIRWAWDTWARRREEYEARVAEARFGHLRVHRISRPSELDSLRF